MINLLKEKRQNTETRKIFDNVIADLRDVLSCYDKTYHYEVIINYLNTYNLFNTELSIRGRILYELGYFFNREVKQWDITYILLVVWLYFTVF